MKLEKRTLCSEASTGRGYGEVVDEWKSRPSYSKKYVGKSSGWRGKREGDPSGAYSSCSSGWPSEPSSLWLSGLL